MHPIYKRSNLSVQRSEGKLTIRDLKANREFYLNEVESRLWELLDGKHSADMLIEILAQEYGLDRHGDAVWKILDKFSDFNLLEKRINPPASQTFYDSGLITRRQFSKIVRQFSLGVAGAAIAVTIPNVASAQSSEQISKEQSAKRAAEQSSKEQRSKASGGSSGTGSSEQSSKEQSSKEQSSKEQTAKQSAEQSSKEQQSKASGGSSGTGSAEQSSKEQSSKEQTAKR